jgi:hypothetical protein
MRSKNFDDIRRHSSRQEELRYLLSEKASRVRQNTAGFQLVRKSLKSQNAKYVVIQRKLGHGVQEEGFFSPAQRSDSKIEGHQRSSKK